ncbi:MAG TPA: hypothetical protein VIL21_02575 [Solirubrobacterales bacterium]
MVEYAERFNLIPDQAQADFDEFVEVGEPEPLDFWQLEEEELAENTRPTAGGGCSTRFTSRRSNQLNGNG